MLKKHWIVLGLFLLASTAFAEEEGADRGADTFGVLGGTVSGKGNPVLQLGVGQPGLQTKFFYGILSNLDVGGILELNWGEVFDFVLRIQPAARFAFYDNGKLGLSVGFAPGVAIAFVGSEAGVMIPLHLDMSVGVRISRHLTLMSAFEIPIELYVKDGFFAEIPLVAAAGLEYAISSSVKLWSRVRAGHAFRTGNRMASGGLLTFHTGAAIAF